MQYIVLDMEWNQPWPDPTPPKRCSRWRSTGRSFRSARCACSKTARSPMSFRCSSARNTIKSSTPASPSSPAWKDATLREEGLPFRQALERFRSWIGGDCIFLTWGFDDIRILEDNILLHDGEPDWIQKWYNAQMIFNAQTGCGTSQKSLSSAMELMGIPATRPAHDALGDAYHTAVICSRLDLRRGIAEYGKALESHANGFHGAPPEGCISRAVFQGLFRPRQGHGGHERAAQPLPAVRRGHAERQVDRAGGQTLYDHGRVSGAWALPDPHPPAKRTPTARCA